MNSPERSFDLYGLSRYRGEIYGISILWIVLYHAFMIKYEWPAYLAFLKCGLAGCDVFLFLSGISLYFSYIKYENLTKFYVRRFLRIYIPLLTVYLPCLIIRLHFEDLSRIRLLAVICVRLTGMLFWINGNEQIWFISLIIVLYLLYPFIMNFISRGKSGKEQFIRTVILCVIETALMLLIMKLFPSYYQNTRIALGRVQIFTFGCFMGPYIYRHAHIPGKILYLCLAISIVAFVVFGIHWLGYYRAGQFTQLFFGGIAITICLAKLFDILSGTKLCFINKAMQFLGGTTLEMYIIHVTAILLYRDGRLFRYNEGRLVPYLFLMCICFALSIPFGRIDQSILNFITRKGMKKNERNME